MLRTVEAIIGENGELRLLEDVELPRNGRVLVTILEDGSGDEAALLSQASLAEDWDRAEEDEAWAHLRRDR